MVKTTVPKMSDTPDQFFGLSKDFCFTLVLGVSCMLVASDACMINTVLPTITDEFNSASDLGWYTSAYFLGACVAHSYFFGLHGTYRPKYVLVAAMIFFEAGSIISCSATSSQIFSWGRGISGFGSAGIFMGSIIVLHKMGRDEYNLKLAWYTMGFLDAVARLPASMIGGILAKLSWRWCFLLGRPLGLTSLYLVIRLAPKLDPEGFDTDDGSPRAEQSRKMDLHHYSASMVMWGVGILLMAVQGLGIDFHWLSVRFASSLAFSVIVMFVLIRLECEKGSEATTVGNLVQSRTFFLGALFCIALKGVSVVIEVYLSVWLQMGRGYSALHTGQLFSAIEVAGLVGSGLSAFGNSRRVSCMSVSGFWICVTIFFLRRFEISSESLNLVGYLAALNIGIGLSILHPYGLAFEESKGNDVQRYKTVNHTLLFAQNMGGALGGSLAYNTFFRHLITSLSQMGYSLTPAMIHSSGLSDLVENVPQASSGDKLSAIYNATVAVFADASGFACLLLLAAALLAYKPINRAFT